jgi:phosphohistidine swiveling domain-containing protein
LNGVATLTSVATINTMNSDKLFLRREELISVSHSRVGGKARELAIAHERGFVVPAFVAIETEVCATLVEDSDRLSRLRAEVRAALTSSTFAVRSCALGEDTHAESKAGLFKTILNVPPDELVSAVRSVLLDARSKLGGSLETFSLIIQEFVDPDYAGVVFTRDPRGRRELVIELAQGRGDGVVEGRKKSKMICGPWQGGSMPELREFPALAQMIEKLKETEREKKWPQDIEWCVVGRQFYLLQVRPITSISDSQYQDILWLEELLPQNEFFLYEKNAITEIAPRPSPLSLDLLKWLAREEGPISNVYRRHGIKYAATNSLRQVGSELYVDREAELRSLLPVAKFDIVTLKPRVRFGKGWLQSVRNITRLSMLASQVTVGNRERLRVRLQKALDLPFEKCEFGEALSALDRDYEIIFEINLLSGIALRNAENILKNEVSLTALLESGAQFVAERDTFEPLKFVPGSLRGNGLDIADDSIFVSRAPAERATPELLNWWLALSELRRKILSGPVLRLVEFTRLREGGRWLTVRHINRLREIAKAEARRSGFEEVDAVFGASVDEIVTGHLSEHGCTKRLEKLRTYLGTNFPVRLSSGAEPTPSKMLGVSSGRARGRLVRREQISVESSSMILFSDSLTPELAEHFGKIAGIVSRHGGLLSHLAILAREAGIPVIVGFELSKDFAIGATVEIDGDRGEIELSSQSY